MTINVLLADTEWNKEYLSSIRTTGLNLTIPSQMDS